MEKIDYGTWNVPKSWDELDLKTFSKIEEYYSGKDKEFDIREVLSILCDKTQDEVNSLPMEFTEKIVSQLSWLGEEPKHGEPTNKMKINGEEYIVNFQSKLTFGEYAATEMVRKDNPHNYAAILAILCRKEGEKYDSTFENEVLPSRIEMWEKQPMMKVMPILFFFINLFVTLQMSTQLSSEVEEGLNHIRQSIDNSPKIGVFKKYYLKWRMKTLLKSLKSINYT
jgi:hypothetical protein